MNRRAIRQIVAIVILLGTIAAGWYFLASHPNIGQQLLRTPLLLTGLLLGLYGLFMVSLWLIFRGSLKLCRANLPKGETLLVTCYSSIINFFGPLQSGPAFRALYLKKRHSVSVKDYASASFVYYFFYAYYSGLFILVGVIGWWVLLLGVFGLLLILGFAKLPRTLSNRVFSLDASGFGYTAAATLLQVSLLLIIFYIELHSFNSSVTLKQAIVYTGSANLALFVSITPGAIGFRESFVLLTTRLHHIPNDVVVAASLLDRGVYVLLILLLAVAIFASRARQTIRRLTT